MVLVPEKPNRSMCNVHYVLGPDSGQGKSFLGGEMVQARFEAEILTRGPYSN
jgi:hypothetical protein